MNRHIHQFAESAIGGVAIDGLSKHLEAVIGIVQIQRVEFLHGMGGGIPAAQYFILGAGGDGARWLVLCNVCGRIYLGAYACGIFRIMCVVPRS